MMRRFLKLVSAVLASPKKIDRPSVRLYLEPLEDRMLLATRVWLGGGNTHNWSDGTNWEFGLIPGPSDTASFGGANQIVNVDGNPQVLNLDIAFTFVGSTINIANSLRVTGGNMQEGTINGPGDLIFIAQKGQPAGSFNWSDGRMARRFPQAQR